MSRIQKNATIFSFAIILTFLVMYVLFINILGVVGALIMASAIAGITLIAGGIAYAIQYYRQERAFAQKQKAVDDRSEQQIRTIEIDLPFVAAFDLALEALETLDDAPIPRTLTGIPSKQRLKIHQANSDMGRLRAGLQAKTFGIQDVFDFSRIEIQLQRMDSTSTRLQIESEPANSLEYFDLGRHMHYVNHLALYIREMSQPPTTINQLVDDEATLDGDDADHDQSRVDCPAASLIVRLNDEACPLQSVATIHQFITGQADHVAQTLSFC